MSEHHQGLPISTGQQTLLVLTGGLVVLIVLMLLIAKMVFGAYAAPIEKTVPAVAAIETAAVAQADSASNAAASTTDERIKPVGEVNLAQPEVSAPSVAAAETTQPPVAQEAPPAVVSPPASDSVPAPSAKKLEQPADPPAPVQAAKQDAGNASDEQHSIQQAVQGWAAAWSQQNVEDYLAFYAKDFKTQDGKSRDQWESTRRDRIAKAKAIKVVVENLQVNFLDATHAHVTLHQTYRSNALQDVTNKTLMMVKSDNRWLIQEEKAGN